MSNTTQDALELELIAIWASVLGHQEFGISDSFFDVGGSSFLLMSMIAQVRDKLGYDLELSRVMRAPSINAIRSLIRGSIVKEFTAIVPLQPIGIGDPLFCLHPIGGSPIRYFVLARELGAGYRTYGLQPPALAGVMEAPDDVQQIASNYIDEIRGNNFELARCSFVGYSFGGLLAFEMARQVYDITGHAPGLVLIDAGLDYTEVDPERYPLRVMIYYTFNLKFDMAALSGLSRQDALQCVQSAAIDQGVLAYGDYSTTLERIFEVVSGNCRAAQSYEPLSFPGQVLLYRSGGKLGGDTDLGWAESIPDLRIVPVESDHIGMLDKEAIEQMLPTLKSYLESR